MLSGRAPGACGKRVRQARLPSQWHGANNALFGLRASLFLELSGFVKIWRNVARVVA
jgi:hypothetical protein